MRLAIEVALGVLCVLLAAGFIATIARDYRRRSGPLPPTLLSCARHGDLYLVVPGVGPGDLLVASEMTSLKADLDPPRPGSRFGFCPYGCGEPIRCGPVPRPVGRW